MEPTCPAPGVSFGGLVLWNRVWLPLEFYKPSASTDKRWRLSHILQWCEGEYWNHKRTGTLLGGPYGIKWAVIVLVYLGSQYIRIKNTRATRPEGYEHVAFEERDFEKVAMQAEILKSKLSDSEAILRATYEDRLRSPSFKNPEIAYLINFTPECISDVVVLVPAEFYNEWTVSKNDYNTNTSDKSFQG